MPSALCNTYNAPMRTARFSDHQRLDTLDQKRIAEFGYDYDMRSLGTVLGGGFHGAASPVRRTEWITGAEYFMELGKFGVVVSQSVGTEAAEEVLSSSKVVQFDPTQSGHQNYPIDFTAQRALALAGGWDYYPFIWVAARDYQDQIDNRRFWDTGTATEVVDPAYATVLDTRLEFAVSVDEPAGLGWTKIAKVTNWLSGLAPPLIQTEFYFDSDAMFEYLGLANESRIRYSDTTGVELSSFDIKELPRSLGVLGHLLLLRRQIHNLIAFGTEDPDDVQNQDWDARPLLSLNGAYKELTALSPIISGHTAQLNDQFVAGTGIVKYVPNNASPNAGAVTQTHGRGLSVSLVAGSDLLIFEVRVAKPEGFTTVEWAAAYVTAVHVSEILAPGVVLGHVDAKQPLRILPVIAEANQQVSDFFNDDGVMEFQVQVFHDQDQDGVWKPVEDESDGFDWAQFVQFRFSITVHCSLNP